jgi:hypothetical protein
MQNTNAKKENELNIDKDLFKSLYNHENKDNSNAINKKNNANKNKNNSFNIFLLNNYNNIAEINNNKKIKSEKIIDNDMNNKMRKNELINISKKNLKNNINNKNGKKDFNYLHERYIITDNYGNPIIINGKQLLAMKLIPLIGENGKETIDKNGDLIIIGPDGQPKTQKQIKPILLDNNIPLITKENKQFLGLCGVALINEEGHPITSKHELNDKDNKVIGQLGFLAKDNLGNLIKFNNNNNNIKYYEKNSNNYGKINLKNILKKKIGNKNMDNHLNQIKLPNSKLINNNYSNFSPKFRNNQKRNTKLYKKPKNITLKMKGKNDLKVPTYHKNLSESNSNKNKVIKRTNLEKNIKISRRDTIEKGKLNYSECNANSHKKINFRKNSNN